MTDQEFLRLSRTDIFRNIELSRLKKLFSSISYTVKSYEKGSIVKIRGEKYENLLIVINGELEAEINDLSGKNIKIETLKSPSAAASGILFASDPVLPVTLTAGNNSKVISISKDSMLTLFNRSGEILINYLENSGDKIVFLAEKIRLFKFTNLRQKSAGYLLDLSARYNSDIFDLPYTRETIAEIFGVTRPSLSRVFSDLAKEGLISLKGRTARIKKREALLKIAAGSGE